MSSLESRDPRIPPPFVTAGERAMLNAWLDFHRATLIWKCTGLTDEQLCQRSVPPSSLSLLGLVRHMAKVERHWFQQVFLGTPSPRLYSTETNQDGDFDDLKTAEVAADFAQFAEECRSARIAEAPPSRSTRSASTYVKARWCPYGGSLCT